MKYLGTNFIAKIKAWINANFATKAAFEQHAVWAKGEGEDSIVAAYNDHFMPPTASGKRATAEGSGTASGNTSHAEGSGTASGNTSHAEGNGTASGYASHAEGYGRASGNTSHAEVYGKASGDFSHAEGSGTASGMRSHAEGSDTEAKGMYSHAEGWDTKAIGSRSHAEGWLTTAKGPGSHAEGYHNVENSNCIHSVGIGSDRYDGSGKNAEYIYMLAKDEYNWQDDPKNGYKYLIGVGGYDGISTDNSTYKSVQEVIADLTARIEQLEKLTANCVSISNVDEQTN